jgi:hypothetical protein
MVLVGDVRQGSDCCSRPQITLKPVQFVDVHHSLSRQPVRVVHPLREFVSLEPADESVAGRTGDAELLLNLVSRQRFLDEEFEQLAVLEHVEEVVGAQSLGWYVGSTVLADELHRRLEYSNYF